MQCNCVWENIMKKLEQGVKIVKTVKRTDKDEVVVHNCGVYTESQLNREQADRMIEEWNKNPEPNCTYSVEDVQFMPGFQMKIDK